MSGSVGPSGRGHPLPLDAAVLESSPKPSGILGSIAFRLKGERSRSSRASRTCKECQFWFPSDAPTSFGECESARSPKLGLAVYRNDMSAACFTERSYAGVTFLWCRTCRETSPAGELFLHSAHDVYIASAGQTVEDAMETTVAGD